MKEREKDIETERERGRERQSYRGTERTNTETESYVCMKAKERKNIYFI